VIRLLQKAGYELSVTPLIDFVERPLSRGRIARVPIRLPRLSVDQAFRTVQLPFHVNWSDPERSFNLMVRSERARVYEIVLREGRPEDILAFVDGALLVDLWNDLVLPRDLRAAWAPVMAVPQPPPHRQLLS
jgi:hypothetical protein